MRAAFTLGIRRRLWLPIAMAGLLAAAVLPWLIMDGADREDAVVDWTGKNGVVEIFGGDRLEKRYLEIRELSTVTRVEKGMRRTVREGRGYLDANLNFRVDPDEKKVYFQISEFTNFIFFEQPDITDQ